MKDIWNKYKIIIIIALAFIVFIALVRICEREPKVITKTKTTIEYKTDTIIKTVISEPKIVYVNRYINQQGEKEIVYVQKPTDSTTIKANQYETSITSNNASARLKITTSGELLDVSGTIDYPKETVTNTNTIIKEKSGLFLYGIAPIQRPINAEAGLMYQFKNSVLILGGAQYNEFTKSVDVKVGLGIKIF